MWQGFSWGPVVAILIGPIIIWIAHHFQQAKVQSQRDVQLALLAKFSSGEEMTRFLATEEGKRLIEHLSSPGEDDPRQKAVGMLTVGSILTALGIGFAGLALMQGMGRLVIPAVVIGSVGLGFFIGATISHRFAKKMGLIRERS
jgi:hypothetical protein